MNQETIESILQDFRTWLVEATAPSPPAAAVETVDLFTLLSQFTALRHEVNMQTKAARAAVESNTETLRLLAAVKPSESVATTRDDEDLRPLLKAVLDIADALELAHSQVERLRGTIEPLLSELRTDRPTGDAPELPIPPRGLLSRLLRSSASEDRETVLRKRLSDQLHTERERTTRADQAAAKVSQLLLAAAEGYTLSRRRVDRVLPTYDLERIATVGEMFDPDTMEAVERVERADRPPGEVLGEVRPGYLWKGRILRYAQVRVATSSA